MIESAIQTICGEDHLSKFNIGLNINAQELFDQVSENFITIFKKNFPQNQINLSKNH